VASAAGGKIMGPGGDIFSTIASLYLIAAVLMTILFGEFLQWIPIILAIVVGGWATQAASKKSKGGKRGRR
jgi:uncharacterized membrane protein